MKPMGCHLVPSTQKSTWRNSKKSKVFINAFLMKIVYWSKAWLKLQKQPRLSIQCLGNLWLIQSNLKLKVKKARSFGTSLSLHQKKRRIWTEKRVTKKHSVWRKPKQSRNGKIWGRSWRSVDWWRSRGLQKDRPCDRKMWEWKGKTDAGEITHLEANGVNGQRYTQHCKSHTRVVLRYSGGCFTFRFRVQPQKWRGRQKATQSVAQNV